MKQIWLGWQFGVRQFWSAWRPPAGPTHWPLSHPSLVVDPRLNWSEVKGQGWRPGPLAWSRGVELKARSLFWPWLGPHEHNMSCRTDSGLSKLWVSSITIIQMFLIKKILFMSNMFINNTSIINMQNKYV